MNSLPPIPSKEQAQPIIRAMLAVECDKFLQRKITYSMLAKRIMTAKRIHDDPEKFWDRRKEISGA